MNGLQKTKLFFQGWCSCIGWMLEAIFKAVLANCPDLKFWETHTNFNDHFWYAERVNGRLAMLVLTALLIWKLSHEPQLDKILF